MQSESIANLATALSKAQGAMGAASMAATNPFLHNKYADLGEVIKAAKKPLADNGLAVSQIVTIDGALVSVKTLLMHASGEWLASNCAMTIVESKGLSTAQVAGSIITYLRRYALASIVGLYSDQDDDGNTATETKAQAKPVQQQNAKTAKPAQPAASTALMPAAQPNILMTTAEACEITTRDGVRYGDLDTETLMGMTGSINKSLTQPNLTQAEIDDRLRKLTAIEVILNDRVPAEIMGDKDNG